MKTLAIVLMIPLLFLSGSSSASHSSRSACLEAGGNWDSDIERCAHCNDNEYYNYDSHTCVAREEESADTDGESDGATDYSSTSDGSSGESDATESVWDCETDADCTDAGEVCDTNPDTDQKECREDCAEDVEYDWEDEECIIEAGGKGFGWGEFTLGSVIGTAATAVGAWLWDSDVEDASEAVNEAREAADAAASALEAAQGAATEVSTAANADHAMDAAENALDAAEAAQEAAEEAAKALEDVKSALEGEDATAASKALLGEAKEANQDATRQANDALESAKTAVDQATKKAVDEAVEDATSKGNEASSQGNLGNTADQNGLESTVRGAGDSAQSAATKVASGDLAGAQADATSAREQADRAEEYASAIAETDGVTPAAVAAAQEAAAKARAAADAAQAAVDAAKARKAAIEALNPTTRGESPDFGAAQDALEDAASSIESIGNTTVVEETPGAGDTAVADGGSTAGGDSAPCGPAREPCEAGTGDSSEETYGSGQTNPGNASWENAGYGTSSDGEGGDFFSSTKVENFLKVSGSWALCGLSIFATIATAGAAAPLLGTCALAIGVTIDVAGGDSDADAAGSGGVIADGSGEGGSDCGLCVSTQALTEPATPAAAVLPDPAGLARTKSRFANRSPVLSIAGLLGRGEKDPANPMSIYIEPCRRVYHLLASGVLGGAEEIVERHQRWFNAHCGFLDAESLGEPSGDGCTLLSDNITHVEDLLSGTRERGADERAVVDEEILAQLAGVFETSCTDPENEDSCLPLLNGDGESQGIVVTNGGETTLFQNQCLDMDSDPDAEDPIQVLYACDDNRMTMDSFPCSKCIDHSGEELTMCRVREAP